MLTAHRKLQLRANFAQVDTAGRGFIEYHQFHALLQSLDFKLIFLDDGDQQQQQQQGPTPITNHQKKKKFNNDQELFEVLAEKTKINPRFDVLVSHISTVSSPSISRSSPSLSPAHTHQKSKKTSKAAAKYQVSPNLDHQDDEENDQVSNHSKVDDGGAPSNHSNVNHSNNRSFVSLRVLEDWINSIDGLSISSNNHTATTTPTTTTAKNNSTSGGGGGNHTTTIPAEVNASSLQGSNSFSVASEPPHSPSAAANNSSNPTTMFTPTFIGSINEESSNKVLAVGGGDGVSDNDGEARLVMSTGNMKRGNNNSSSAASLLLGTSGKGESFRNFFMSWATTEANFSLEEATTLWNDRIVKKNILDFIKSLMLDVTARGNLETPPKIIISNAVHTTYDALLANEDQLGDEFASSSASSFVGSPTSSGASSMKKKSRVHKHLNAFVSRIAQIHYMVNPAAKLIVNAAILFVDISGYSRITRKLAHLGAHVLSMIVNGYLSEIIQEVKTFDGDVVKFAGDAMVVLWRFNSFNADKVIAKCCRCALTLVKEHGNYPVYIPPVREGGEAVTTEESWGIHIGVAVGPVTSRVFESRQLYSSTSPQCFHYLSGDTMNEVGICAEKAAKNQVVMTGEAAKYLEKFSHQKIECSERVDSGGVFEMYQLLELDLSEIDDFFSDVDEDCVKKDGSPLKAGLGGNCQQHPQSEDDLRWSSTNKLLTRLLERDSTTAATFIPPAIAETMRSGMNPFFMAQLRRLVVLFIAFDGKTEESVWFDEVIRVIDAVGANVIQVIDDDKGCHMVVAFNLYSMDTGAQDSAVTLALTLFAKHTNSKIGVASGMVFCGVLGSTEACQWDITGDPCVRACRLMQHAMTTNVTAVFDRTVAEAVKDRSRLMSFGSIPLKGQEDAVEIFGLTVEVSKLTKLLSSRSSIIEQRTLSLEPRTPIVTPNSMATATTPMTDPTAALTRNLPLMMFFHTICAEVHRELTATLKRILLTGKLGPPDTTSHSNDNGDGDDQARSRAEGKACSLTSSSKGCGCGLEGKKETDSTSATTKEEGNGEMFSRTVILQGCIGCGKFSVALNALRDTHFVPIVFVAKERQQNDQLGLLETLASWFSMSTDTAVLDSVKPLKKALLAHHRSHAFRLGLELLRVVFSSHSERSYAIIIQHGQFLDVSSLAFVGKVTETFRTYSNFAMFITCFPLHRFKDPGKMFSEFGVHVIDVLELTDNEATSLFEFCLGGHVSSSLQSRMLKKTGNLAECVVSLAEYLRNEGLLTISKGGRTHVSEPDWNRCIKSTLWDQIAPSFTSRAVNLLDHLTPHLLSMAKIVCAITEQPGISAFFYSVNRVCEIMHDESLNVEAVKYLEQLRLLRLCEHKCTAHTGTGELDAAIFYTPALRDIVQSILVPQQRSKINQICGDVYADTHPMNHPMQFLVRARHYLFSGNEEKFGQDFEIGWAMIRQKTSGDEKFPPNVVDAYVEWMELLPDGRGEELLQMSRNTGTSGTSSSSSPAYRPLRRRSSLLSMSTNNPIGRGVTMLLSRINILERTPKLRPLSMGPARYALSRILFVLRNAVEFIDEISDGGGASTPDNIPLKLIEELQSHVNIFIQLVFCGCQFLPSDPVVPGQDEHEIKAACNHFSCAFQTKVEDVFSRKRVAKAMSTPQDGIEWLTQLLSAIEYHQLEIVPQMWQAMSVRGAQWFLAASKNLAESPSFQSLMLMNQANAVSSKSSNSSSTHKGKEIKHEEEQDLTPNEHHSPMLRVSTSFEQRLEAQERLIHRLRQPNSPMEFVSHALNQMESSANIASTAVCLFEKLPVIKMVIDQVTEGTCHIQFPEKMEEEEEHSHVKRDIEQDSSSSLSSPSSSPVEGSRTSSSCVIQSIVSSNSKLRDAMFFSACNALKEFYDSNLGTIEETEDCYVQFLVFFYRWLRILVSLRILTDD